MSYANKYYPDYKKLYPGVEITPEILAVLRASDRQMRRFEEELKAEGFESDNKKQTARFIPSREDSYERLVQDENCQFSDPTADVEDAVLRRETMRHLHRALAQLEEAELELIQAYYYQELTERECAAAAGIKQSSFHKRHVAVLCKLKDLIYSLSRTHLV